MKYTIRFNRTNGVCTFNVIGDLHSPEDSFILQAAAAEASVLYQCCLFLIDLSSARVISGTLQAYEAGNPKDEIKTKLKKFKTSVLYKKLTEHEYFFETVAVNRGFALKVFSDRDKAFNWLMKNEY